MDGTKTYLESLSPVQKANISILVAEMKAKGITNAYTQAAILAIVSKESSFIPKNEDLQNYTAERITEVWPYITLAIAKTLEHNAEKLGNYVYGGKYGNASNEGYKYRGRGFNQITFKGNYKSVGERIGIDLVSNPDLMLDPKIAAKATVDFFIREFATAKKLGYLKKYNTTDINGFKNATDSLNAVFQANRGWTKTGVDTTGGYKKASERISALQTFTNFVDNNKGNIVGATLFFFSIGCSLCL